MPEMKGEITYVTVSTLQQLRSALAPYTKNGRENARQLLLDGLSNVRTQIEAHEKTEAEIKKHADVFGGMLPPPMQNPSDGYHYVDEIIKKKLGGKRVGCKVRWAISDGIYEWDAFEDILVKCGK